MFFSARYFQYVLFITISITFCVLRKLHCILCMGQIFCVLCVATILIGYVHQNNDTKFCAFFSITMLHFVILPCSVHYFSFTNFHFVILLCSVHWRVSHWIHMICCCFGQTLYSKASIWTLSEKYYSLSTISMKTSMFKNIESFSIHNIWEHWTSEQAVVL